MSMTASDPAPAVPGSGEPRLAALASWAVLAASFGLSAATWISLATLAGFTATATIPVVGATLALAWLMPVAVDGYVVVALLLWMAPVPAKVARFARTNTYVAAGIGVAAQSAYHALHVWTGPTGGGQLWRAVLAAIVGALPPAVAALAVHMRALIRRESTTSGTATVPTVSPSVPMASLPVLDGEAALVGMAGQSGPVPAEVIEAEPVITADLLSLARIAAHTHRQATGRTITRDRLRAVLRVANKTASELMRRLAEDEPDSPSPGRAGSGLVPVTADVFTRSNNVPATATGVASA